MALYVNTNVSSINAQRKLANSTYVELQMLMRIKRISLCWTRKGQ